MVFSFSRPAAAGPGAACTHPSTKLYPGDRLSKLRYGVVEFNFELCSGKPPATWKATVGTKNVNRTGKGFGFSIEDAAISETDGGYYYRFYEGQIQWKMCSPVGPVPGLCVTTGPFDIEFYAYDVDGRTYLAVTKMPADNPRNTLTLFKTP